MAFPELVESVGVGGDGNKVSTCTMIEPRHAQLMSSSVASKSYSWRDTYTMCRARTVVLTSETVLITYFYVPRPY